MSHIPKPRTKLSRRTDVRVLRGGTRRYKRPRYHRYAYFDHSEIDQIQNLLKDPKYGDCAYIAYEHKIPSSTVRTWKSKIEKDPDYDIRKGYKRNRRSIFTEEEEEALADYIRTNIIKPGQFFTDQDFRTIAMTAFLEKYQDAEETPQFNCSNGFIYSFKKRHGFSSRRAHIKRRPAVSEDGIKQWKERIKKLLREQPKDHIINVDETAWFFYPKGLLTWANKGSSDISIQIGGNDKENITALCAITATGTRLPMMLIAAGKTQHVEESQLGDVHPHWTAHSENGWTTEDTFMQYLDHIAQYFNNEPVHMILDVYAAHRTESVKQFAEALNITLYFIPPGCTDLVQPLDVKVFGALKATAKFYFRQRYQGVASPKVTSKEAVENLIRAWESLSHHLTEEAWNIYEEENPEEEE